MKKALILLILIVIAIVAIILNYNNILKTIYKTSYSDYVEKYSKEYNVDPLLIYSIIKLKVILMLVQFQTKEHVD